MVLGNDSSAATDTAMIESLSRDDSTELLKPCGLTQSRTYKPKSASSRFGEPHFLLSTRYPSSVGA
jgi:hypothetical protein